MTINAPSPQLGFDRSLERGLQSENKVSNTHCYVLYRCHLPIDHDQFYEANRNRVIENIIDKSSKMDRFDDFCCKVLNLAK
jgi:hypothetical protein